MESYFDNYSMGDLYRINRLRNSQVQSIKLSKYRPLDLACLNLS